MSFGSETGQLQTRIEFNTYLDGLYGYAVVVSRNRSEAEDLVQETDYIALLETNQIRFSMSRRATPWDNVARESFVKTLKYEEVYRLSHPRRQAHYNSHLLSIFEVFERHSRLIENVYPRRERRL